MGAAEPPTRYAPAETKKLKALRTFGVVPMCTGGGGENRDMFWWDEPEFRFSVVYNTGGGRDRGVQFMR